jgi:hypothetical protein
VADANSFPFYPSASTLFSVSFVAFMTVALLTLKSTTVISVGVVIVEARLEELDCTKSTVEDRETRKEFGALRVAGLVDLFTWRPVLLIP